MWRLLPAAFAFLVLGAHFLREGGLMAFAVCVIAPGVALAYRRGWVLRVLQALLAFGCFIWVSTAIETGQERMANDRPFMRMACILGAVALFTAASAWLLGRPGLRQRYR